MKLALLWIESFECVVLRSFSSGQGNKQARASLSIWPWAVKVETSLVSAVEIKLGGGGGGGAMETETSPLPRPLPREVTTQPSLSVSRIVWGKCRYPGKYGSGVYLCFWFAIKGSAGFYKCCGNGIGPWNLIWGWVRYHFIYFLQKKSLVELDLLPSVLQRFWNIVKPATLFPDCILVRILFWALNLRQWAILN